VISQARKVTFVIVTYRSCDIVAGALDAVRTSWEAGIADCIVVDNASDDGTAEFVHAKYPWVHLIRSEENLGFGCGCNLGFQLVHSPYVLFLNPDAAIELSGVRVMLEVMHRRPTAAVVAPAINESGESWQSAGLMTTIGTLIRSSAGFRDPFPDARIIISGETAFRTSWVCGAVMLIRSESFRQVGGFDPQFFLYFEETDLCRRITQQGGGIWATGEAIARHSAGHSARATNQTLTSNCVSEHYFRSRFRYLVKHFGRMKAVAAIAIASAAERLRSLKRRVTCLLRGGIRRPSIPASRKLPASPKDNG
jgi:N-acetylglucosaminyl-diphospho-decaprenol L-rhamnosyltransferase